PVAGIVPGVLGKTGIETSEIIEAVCERIKPCALIVIDALASRKLSRLGTTVQMTDTGISPGSGVGNARSEISERKLGIPVVAVGVPTVVDGATMAFDLLENAGLDGERLLKSGAFSKETPMMVTPKEIDLVIERAAMLISMGINSAMQPSLSLDDIIAIVK
ncbi:MAG: GPR endopeptidase, partial [Clostridia bacterium]|nr:GPR endopeptidase [Clostridia bacterium]